MEEDVGLLKEIDTLKGIDAVLHTMAIGDPDRYYEVDNLQDGLNYLHESLEEIILKLYVFDEKYENLKKELDRLKDDK